MYRAAKGGFGAGKIDPLTSAFVLCSAVCSPLLISQMAVNDVTPAVKLATVLSRAQF
jgi:hypothetical protein